MANRQSLTMHHFKKRFFTWYRCPMAHVNKVTVILAVPFYMHHPSFTSTVEFTVS